MTIPAAGPGGRAPSINVDNVRVAKMQGGSIENSTVIKGMVIMRDAEGTVKHVTDAKVAVFGCSVEAAGTEAKGTVLIEDAGEMVNYNKSEESMMDDNIRAIAESGATVIVSGGSISEMAMHFIEKYNLLAIKILSKFELRRICRATGATAVMRLGTVMEEEMGHADDVAVKEMGGRKNIVIRQDNPDMGIISTIILRSSTKNLLEDLERAADDGVNAARALCRDPRLLPGAGASDMEMSNLIAKYGESLPGLDQYAVAQFARAMQVVPHTLSINAGQDADEMMARLQAAHEEGKSNEGVNIEEVDATLDAGEAAIFDILAIKLEALRLACNAAITVLRVDQIIMSKQAGGPKAPQ
jgi:T-complex protein 1 subunit theta